MDTGGWDALLQSIPDKRPTGRPTGRGHLAQARLTCSSFHRHRTPGGSDLLPPSVGHWSGSGGTLGRA